MCQTLFAIALAFWAGSAAAAQHPDLTGRWSYNVQQSDNPRDMLGRDSAGGGGERRSGGMGGFGGGRRGFGGGRGGFGGGRGGREGGATSDAARERMRQTMQLVFDAPQSLALAQTDSTVALTSERDTLVLSSSGRKVHQKVEGQGDVDIKGRWLGNDFVVERSVAGGGKVTEDYMRTPDGAQLFVIVSFEGGSGRSMTFRRVYDKSN